MAFKLPKGLERIVLGVTGALVIAGTPLYTKTAEAQSNKNSSNYSLYVSSFDRYTQKNYKIPVGEKDTKEIFLAAKKVKEPLSLEIIFGINNAEKISEKKADMGNLPLLDQGFSKFTIIRPKKVKILGTEQEAYIFPKKKFMKLSPLEETFFSKKIVEWGETLVDNLIPLFIVKPVKEFREWFTTLSSTKEEQEYLAKVKKLEKEMGENYTFEKMEFFKSNKLGNDLEMMRKIKTRFDASELEGGAYMLALLKPAIGNSSTSYRGTGNWIEMGFFIQGEKMPYWIKKQEIGAESIPTREGIINIFKKRKTKEIVAYNPPKKKLIVYSYDGKEIEGDVTKSRKTVTKIMSLYLSIEKDLKREGFSKEGSVLMENKENYILETNIGDFYRVCRDVESR